MVHQGRVSWASARGLLVWAWPGQSGSGQWASLQTIATGPSRVWMRCRRWSQMCRRRWQCAQVSCSTVRIRCVKTVSAGQVKRIGGTPRDRRVGWHYPMRTRVQCFSFLSDRCKKKDPQIVEVLKGLVEPVTGGDPMSDTKYV